MRRPRTSHRAASMALLLAGLPFLYAAGPVSGKLTGRVLAAGDNRVVVLDRDGKVIWQHPAALVHDAWMLPNGNVLFADGRSVTEVTPEHRVEFRFEPAEQRGGGAYACQRLSNGNTLIGENSTGRVLEVDRTGKIVFELKTAHAAAGEHYNLRMARKLESGNYLVCHAGAHLVVEYAPDGTVVWQQQTPNLAFAAVRTARGTTLVSTLDRLIEYDSSGKVAWQFANTDLPGTTITNMTGLQLLPNGNVAAGCYRAYNGQAGTGLFEITRERRLLWRYADPQADGSMMAIQRLDERGRPLPGGSLR